MIRKGTMVEINHDENGEFSQWNQLEYNLFSGAEELCMWLVLAAIVALLAFSGYGAYRAIAV